MASPSGSANGGIIGRSKQSFFWEVYGYIYNINRMLNTTQSGTRLAQATAIVAGGGGGQVSDYWWWRRRWWL